ncbi:MAG: serine hydrolase domain-containing protein [Bergeyella sp.]
MRSVILVFFIAIISIVSCRKNPETLPEEQKIETPEDAVSAFKKKLYENQIDSVFKKYNFNGSIAVFQDSLPVARKDSGYLDFASQKKIDENSVFAIGSVSKQFTAVMILLLQEQQKLNIEDKVSQYLPEFDNSEKKEITIHQLLNHTSGISDSGNGLLFKSGTEFSYSNKGYFFLGEIIAKVSGKSYDENAGDLFEKAGLNTTFTPETLTGTHFAGAFTGNEKRYEKVENMPKRLSDKSISVSAGGILSTVNDLHRWNQKLYGGKILNEENLKIFLSKSTDRQHPIFGKMGYGCGIMMYPSTPLSYFHSGYVKGSPSLNVYYPETKTSLIILSNIADEAKGKNEFFNPHVEMKTEADKIETVVAKLGVF